MGGWPNRGGETRRGLLTPAADLPGLPGPHARSLVCASPMKPFVVYIYHVDPLACPVLGSWRLGPVNTAHRVLLNSAEFSAAGVRQH